MNQKPMLKDNIKHCKKGKKTKDLKVKYQVNHVF